MKIPLLIKNFITFKGTFIKLLLSYVLLSFLILFITTFSLFQGYKNQILIQADGIYDKLLRQADYYTQNTLNWANSFVYQLYIDDNIYNLMYNSSKLPSDYSEGILKLGQASSVIPLTQSIYIYNNNLNMFYSSDGLNYSSDSFYDQDIVSILRKSSSSHTSTFIPRQIKLPNRDTYSDVLTIILANNKLEDNGLPEGAIVLNLNAKEIGSYFKDISNDDNDLFAINGDGMVILNSKTNTFYEDISNLDYIKKILDSKGKQGNFIEKVDGASYIINFKTSDRMNLKFINITPYQTLLDSMNSMINLLLIMFILIFIIGIPVSYLISKKVYSPIDRIVKNLRKSLSSSVPIDKNKNELDYLSSAIDDILSTSASLKKLSNEDSAFIKQKILKDLLLNSLNNVQMVEKKLLELNIHLEPKNFMVFVLRIDSYKTFLSTYSKENIESAQHSLADISTEIVSSKYNCEAVNMETDHISIILNIGDKPSSEVVLDLIELIKQIQDRIFNSFHFTVSAGIGSFASKVSELPKSYKWAREYTNYKIKYGANSILYYAKVAPEIKENYKYPDEKEKLLFDAIKSAKVQEVDLHLNSILQELLDYRYPDILMSIMQLTMNSKKLLNNLKKVSDEDLLINFDFFRESLEQFESINEVHHWLMSTYNRALLQLQDTKDHKKEKLVDKIIAYIELNYANSALSPEHLADYVNISPNYLRTIFKEIKNQSLSNYINEYRFEKAKHLLETTHLAVNDICEKIGFANTNYFYTSFKRYHGVSPTEWRNNIHQ